EADGLTPAAQPPVSPADRIGFPPRGRVRARGARVRAGEPVLGRELRATSARGGRARARARPPQLRPPRHPSDPRDPSAEAAPPAPGVPAGDEGGRPRRALPPRLQRTLSRLRGRAPPRPS